jgi:dUTPase
MVFVKIDMPELVATDVLSPSSRDKGGFGSTNDKGL